MGDYDVLMSVQPWYKLSHLVSTVDNGGGYTCVGSVCIADPLNFVVNLNLLFKEKSRKEWLIKLFFVVVLV